MTAWKGNSTPPSGVRFTRPASSNAFTSACTAFTSRPTRRAASRIDTRPAPHSTLSSSQRFAVRTCHSSSGVAKAIRASRSPRRVFITRDASASVSASERTSRTTVFIIPPLYIRSEVDHQLIGRRERISRGGRPDMPVVTFTTLVVIPQDALATNHVCQPILECMGRRRQRLRQAPNRDFRECIRSEHHTALHQQSGQHVGDHANRQQVLSTAPTLPRGGSEI